MASLLPFRRERGMSVTDQLRLMSERLDDTQAQLTSARTELTEARQSLVMSRAALLAGSENQSDPTQVGVYETLANTYEQVPWISAPIDAIAKRMTSGGFELLPVTKHADPANKKKAENLFYYINEDEDLVEICQLLVTALLVFGRGFWEVDWLGTPEQSIPTALYYVDPVTMSPKFDRYGHATHYVQQLEGEMEPQVIDANRIMMFRLRGPRGTTLSPIQKLLSSATVYAHMMRWSQKFFEHGAKPPFCLTLPEETDSDEGDRQLDWYEENYTGADNAHRVWVLWGGAKIQELGAAGKMIEFDFLNSIKYLREEFLAVLGVPPALVNVIESGNIGGGTGDSQDKTFRYNTIEPLKRVVEEKINYVILKKGLGITDWRFCLKEHDYRNDEDIIDLVVKKVDQGLITRNEGRKALGEDGHIDGGEIATVRMPGELVPNTELPEIHSMQLQNTDVDQSKKVRDLQVKQAKQDLETGQQIPQKTAAQFGQAQGTGGSPGIKKSAAGREEATADLIRWQRLALKAVRDGTPHRPFRSSVLQEEFCDILARYIAQATTEDEVRSIFDRGFDLLREAQDEIIRESVKYKVPLDRFDQVRKIVGTLLPSDPHDPKYHGQHLRTEYFDTPDRKLLAERLKQNGDYVVVRLRQYGADVDSWFLEAKTLKEKVRTDISSDKARQFLAGKGCLEHCAKLFPHLGPRLNEITGGADLEPLLRMDYTRWSVVKGMNRITLDRDVKTQDGKVLGFGILELKFEGKRKEYPEIAALKLPELAFSKFIWATSMQSGVVKKGS